MRTAPRFRITDAPDLLTAEEVGTYLRLSGRSVYEFVRTNKIPFCKISGKLLFPKRSINSWLAQRMNDASVGALFVPATPILSGLPDLLLEWSLRESGCGLAFLPSASEDGIARLIAGQSLVAGVCVSEGRQPEDEYAEIHQPVAARDHVVLEWARREQGLLISDSNARKIKGIEDLERSELRIAVPHARDELITMLVEAGVDKNCLRTEVHSPRTDAEVAFMVREKEVDACIATQGAAREAGLNFVPLLWERYDLVLRRFEYFEPPIQKLFAFTQSVEFRRHAAALGGYRIEGCGSVLFNGH